MSDTRVSADQVREATARRVRRQGRARWQGAAWLAAVVFAADQITKEVVRRSMEVGDSYDIAPTLHLRRVVNEGIAFGFFPGNATVVAALTILALVAVSVAMMRVVAGNTPAALGAGMLLGGAAGNLIDRVMHGGVTDFIDFTWFPAFNVADIGITIGAVFLVWGLMVVHDHGQPPGQEL